MLEVGAQAAPTDCARPGEQNIIEFGKKKRDEQPRKIEQLDIKRIALRDPSIVINKDKSSTTERSSFFLIILE